MSVFLIAVASWSLRRFKTQLWHAHVAELDISRRVQTGYAGMAQQTGTCPSTVWGGNERLNKPHGIFNEATPTGHYGNVRVSECLGVLDQHDQEVSAFAGRGKGGASEILFYFQGWSHGWKAANSTEQQRERKRHSETENRSKARERKRRDFIRRRKRELEM